MKAGKERRAETPLSVWALAFSCCIGWGCFIMPGTTFLPAAGPVGTAIAMAVGGALMILIAGSYHYMINLFPDNGGAFTYAKNTFGYDQGFLCGWYLWLAYISLIWANATAFILIIRQLPGNFLAFGFHYQAAGFDVYFGEVLAAGGILVLFGVLSMYAGRLERILHTVLAVLLFASAAACFLMALARSGTADPVPPFSATTSPGVGILSIAALALWVFMGFETVSHVAGEYRFAHKRVFGIMASAVASAGLCYALMTFVAAMRQPDGFSDWQGYIAALGSRRGLEAIPVFFVMDSALGKAGLALLGTAVLSALCTSMIGYFRALSRLTCELSEDGMIPAWFSVRNASDNPRNALLFIIAVSLPVPFLGRTAVGWFTDITTVGASIAYGYTSAAAFWNARRARNWPHAVLGVLGCLLSVLFATFLLMPKSASSSAQLPKESYLILAIWSVLGFLYFRFAFEMDTRNRMNKSIVVWMILLFLIFYCSLMWTRQETRDAAQEAVEHISQAYTQALEDPGAGEWEDRAGQDAAEQEDRAGQDGAFLAERMSEIEQTLLGNTLVQMLMIMAEMYLMISIYSRMSRQESRMEAEMASAVESDKAKSTFLFNMSHDIRTPMNAIIGYTTSPP